MVALDAGLAEAMQSYVEWWTSPRRWRTFTGLMHPHSLWCRLVTMQGGRPVAVARSAHMLARTQLERRNPFATSLHVRTSDTL